MRRIVSIFLIFVMLLNILVPVYATCEDDIQNIIEVDEINSDFLYDSPGGEVVSPVKYLESICIH